MIINPIKEFMFLPAPHTASRAVSAALEELEGSEAYKGILPYHGTFRDAWRHLPHLDLDDFTIFYSVRHPGDWLVTKWMFHANIRGDFSLWVRQQPRQLFRRHDNKFIRYEHLVEDIKQVLGEDVTLKRDPSHSTLRKRPWQEYWTTTDAAWAEAHFEDFNLYGYTMKGERFV